VILRIVLIQALQQLTSEGRLGMMVKPDERRSFAVSKAPQPDPPGFGLIDKKKKQQ
jgi:hypothetical protein